MFRLTLARAQPVAIRAFSTTPAARKTVLDSAKDAVHAVDKTVSKGVLSGIEAGESAAAKVKETAGFAAKDAQIAGEKATLEAQKMGAQARDKAQELGNEAKAKAKEATK